VLTAISCTAFFAYVAERSRACIRGISTRVAVCVSQQQQHAQACRRILVCRPAVIECSESRSRPYRSAIEASAARTDSSAAVRIAGTR